MKVNEPERGTGRINTVRPTPYRPGRNASQQNPRKKLAHNSTHKTVSSKHNQAKKSSTSQKLYFTWLLLKQTLQGTHN